jgi:hypothetical protein
LDDAKAATVDEAPVKQAAEAAAIAGISHRKKERMKKYQKKMKQQQKKSCLSTEKRFN